MPKESSAIAKAISILEVIARERRPVSLATLASATGYPKQTVHRVLQQLDEIALIRRGVRPDQFIMGPRMRDLSIASLEAAVAALPVHAILAALVSDVKESCNIGVLNGLSVLYLDRVEYDWPLRLQINPHDQLPAHCLSMGKLLLAYLDPALRTALLGRARLPRYTEQTITDPEALARELDAIAAQGYALNNQEFHVGLMGAAVPIWDADDRVIAGLAIHGIAPRVSLEALRAHLPRMRQAAGEIAAVLRSEEALPHAEAD